MEPWFICSLVGYSIGAVSGTLDKYIMNRLYSPMTTVMFRTLFNTVFLCSAGLLLFPMALTPLLLLLAAVPALLLVVSFVIYLRVLQRRDATQIQPFSQSMDVLFIFLASIVLLREPAGPANYVGIIVVVLGVYLVVTDAITKIPRVDRNLLVIAGLVPIDVAYALLVKTYLGTVEPIGLAVSINLVSFLFLAVVVVFMRSRLNLTIASVKPHLRLVCTASLFGAMGAALLYTALAEANASKVYPMAGISSVSLFLLATVFLKEKFLWHRFVGTLVVIVGIYLISM